MRLWPRRSPGKRVAKRAADWFRKLEATARVRVREIQLPNGVGRAWIVELMGKSGTWREVRAFYDNGEPIE